MARSATILRLLAVAVGASGVATTQATAQVDTVVVSLADAERMAMDGSPALAAALADVRLSEAQHTKARRARYLPEFNLRNVWGPIPQQRGVYNEFGVLSSPDTLLGISDLSWFTQIELNIVQPLLGFGKASNRIDAAQHGIDLAEAGLDQARGEALFLVRQLYWGVVLGSELEGVVDGLVEEVEEAEVTLLEQYEEGDASQNDLFKFELFKYEVGRRAREVEAGTELARQGLRAAIGLPAGTRLEVADTELEPTDIELDSLDAYLALARENRPELRQISAGILARRALMRAESRDGWPTLFVAGGLRANVAPDRVDPRNPFWQNDTNYTRGFITIGLDWNLSPFQHRDDARLQEYEALKLEAQVSPLSAQVEQEVREAYLRARRAQIDVQEGEVALQATENWLRAELQTYDLGIGQINDVIDAFQANVQMQSQQLQNISDLNRAIAEVNRRVGRDVVGR